MKLGPLSFDDIKQWCDKNSDWAKEIDDANPYMKPYLLAKAKFYMERELTNEERTELVLKYL